MIAAVEPIASAKPKPVAELRQTISASRLNTWLSCRLKFYFHYVLGLRKPKTAALYVGSSVHAILKLWNKARWHRMPFTIETAQQQFESLWQTDQATERVRWKKGKEAGEKQTAWSLLDLYLKQSPIPPNEMPEGVEVSVEADLAKHGLPRLIGILDLVRAGGRIVDFKTVGQTPNDEKAIHTNEVQLSGYSILYRDATGKVEGGRELHQLVKTKKPKLIVTQQGPMTQAQQSRLFRQMDSYVAGLDRQDFVPSPGMQCSMCSFINECKRWS
ncbi:MAG: PD-(D/E)XK nuclease family protein [Limisphaerales bacterium]